MINQKLKEVQDYFKNKLLTEELDIQNISTTTVRVSVDEFPIVLWYGVSESPLYLEIYNGSTVMFDLTDDEKIVIHSKLKQAIREADLQLKMDQYFKLKEELNL